MDKKDQKIQELEAIIKDQEENIERLRDRVAHLTEDPAADFYTAFKESVRMLARGMKDETLDLIEDTYQKSVLLLAKDSDKIFAGIAKGKEMIEEKKTEEEVRSSSKKFKNNTTRAIPIL